MQTEDVSEHFTGSHEIQECNEGQSELDLHTQLSNCKKNPGHLGFVPVNTFSIGDLPDGHQDKELYDFTKSVADVTVRIAVKFTSLDRPEFIPDTKDPYPCYSTRGKNILHIGTGNVMQVSKDAEGIEGGYRTCPCPDCETSDTPKTLWWKIQVATSKHVVFDDSEARQSTCRLWFDDDTSPVIKLYGWHLDKTASTEFDSCLVYFVTHDADIFLKLKEMVISYNMLLYKVHEKYLTKEVDKLVIIVSHPHGCSKQVSIGHWVHMKYGVIAAQVINCLARYAYTTSTCPGSSGALVYRLGSMLAYHRHSGSSATGLNYSSLYVSY